MVGLVCVGNVVVFFLFLKHYYGCVIKLVKWICNCHLVDSRWSQRKQNRLSSMRDYLICARRSVVLRKIINREDLLVLPVVVDVITVIFLKWFTDNCVIWGGLFVVCWATKCIAYGNWFKLHFVCKKNMQNSRVQSLKNQSSTSIKSLEYLSFTTCENLLKKLMQNKCWIDTARNIVDCDLLISSVKLHQLIVLALLLLHSTKELCLKLEACFSVLSKATSSFHII